MSRYFAHTSHAEDQPYAHTLLWAHVLYRGFQTGTVIGITTSSIRAVLRRRPNTLISAGRGAIITTALMVPGTIYRMYGREEIEWQDRSWRLLENKGQVEVDDWSLVGTVAGGLATAVRGGGVVRLVGGAGAGSMLGVGGYLAWRYGVNGGKWPDE